MKTLWWKVIAFLGGIAAVASFWLRERLAPKPDAKVEEAKANVGAAQGAVKDAEVAAAATHESVTQRLADLDAKVIVEKSRDTVDVANDLIKGG